MLALLSPRWRGQQQQQSPAFHSLLASPPPRKRAPKKQPSRLRALLWARLRLGRASLSFLAGVACAVALLGAPRAHPPANLAASCALRADLFQHALFAQAEALRAWRAAAAPCATQLALGLSAAALEVAALPWELWAAIAGASGLLLALRTTWRLVVRVALRVNAVVAVASAAATRRYSYALDAVTARSRAAAALLPHLAVLGTSLLLLRLAPALASLPALCCGVFALPALASLAALRDARSSDATAARPARRWLTYWAAVAPLLFALEVTPMLPRALLASQPGRAACALLLAWLLAPPCRGAELVTRLLTPRLAFLGRRLVREEGPRAARARAALDLVAGSALHALRVPPYAIHALYSGARHVTPLLLACTACILTPPFLARLAAAVASLLAPAASSLAALAAPDAPSAPAYERGWLTFWAVCGACAALAVPAEPLLAWLPLRAHLRLIFALWLQLGGGAPRLASWAAKGALAVVTAARVSQPAGQPGEAVTPAPNGNQADGNVYPAVGLSGRIRRRRRHAAAAGSSPVGSQDEDSDDK